MIINISLNLRDYLYLRVGSFWISILKMYNHRRMTGSNAAANNMIAILFIIFRFLGYKITK